MIGYLDRWATPQRIVEGKEAAKALLSRQQALRKEELMKRKKKMEEGISLMGKKNFEALVRDLATMACKDWIANQSYKISEAAVKKYKKSKDFQADVQKAKMQQKKTTEAKAMRSAVGKKMTQVKKLLSKMPESEQDQVVQQHQLQGLKRQMEETKLPERRPRWILPPKRTG